MNIETLPRPTRPVRYTRLVEIDGSRSFPLPRKILLVGSSALCTIQLPDPGIQEQHAYLLERDGKWFVKPILARCQCRINETAIRDEAPIVHGDILELQGTVSFRFLTRDPALPDASKANIPREPSEFHELFGELLRSPDLESCLDCLTRNLFESFQAHRVTLLEYHSNGTSEIRSSHPRIDSLKASRIQVLIPAEEQNTTLALKPIDPPGGLRDDHSHQGPESVLTAPLGNPDARNGRFFLILERDWGRPAFSSEEVAHLESARTLLGEILQQSRSRQEILERLALAEGNAPIPSSLVHRSKSMALLLDRVHSQADSKAPILLVGESGCGLEDLARTLHAHASRRDAAFRSLACASLSAMALATELFGPDESSARFTSSIAGAGTLFLDGLDHLPHALQARLALALANHTNESADPGNRIRLIAGIEHDLASLSESGALDDALIACFPQAPLVIPPLRERPEDILLVATHLLRRLATRLGVGIPKIGHRAERWLLTQPWTGNVAELEHVLASACVRCEGPSLRPEHLQPDPVSLDEPAPTVEDPRILPTLEAAREAAERAICTQALARSRGNVVKAAELLATDRRTLQRILDRIDLDARAFRNGSR